MYTCMAAAHTAVSKPPYTRTPSVREERGVISYGHSLSLMSGLREEEGFAVHRTVRPCMPGRDLERCMEILSGARCSSVATSADDLQGKPNNEFSWCALCAARQMLTTLVCWKNSG